MDRSDLVKIHISWYKMHISMGVYSNKKSLCCLAVISWKLILPDDRGGEKIKNAPLKANFPQSPLKIAKFPQKHPKNGQISTQKYKIFPKKTLFCLEFMKKTLILPTPPPCE